MENAIKKINEQMQKNPTDVYTEIIGHYIIERCESLQETVDAVNEGKSLEGALEAVTTAAKSKAKNGAAVMNDSEIFNTIDKYLSAPRDDEARQKIKASVDGDTEDKSETQKSSGLDIDFESLI